MKAPAARIANDGLDFVYLFAYGTALNFVSFASSSSTRSRFPRLSTAEW